MPQRTVVAVPGLLAAAARVEHRLSAQPTPYGPWRMWRGQRGWLQPCPT